MRYDTRITDDDSPNSMLFDILCQQIANPIHVKPVRCEWPIHFDDPSAYEFRQPAIVFESPIFFRSQ